MNEHYKHTYREQMLMYIYCREWEMIVELLKVIQGMVKITNINEEQISCVEKGCK